MADKENVKKGHLVKVNYTGKYDSGEVFDQSQDKPLEFITGEKMVVKGFDDAVIGMKKGEKKNITLKPEEAYGEARKELVQEIPKQAFGDKTEQLKEGMTIGLNHPQIPSRMMPALIKKIADDKITIDLNHPLAGKTLNFDLEVVEHKEATDEDRKKFMPPQPEAAQENPEQKPEEKKEEKSEEESCDGNCASCGKH